MGTQIDDDPFFTTLLQGRGEDCNSTATQHSNVVLQSTFNDGEKRHPPKKVQRGASFTAKKDNLLVSTWFNISIDAINVSLMNRWSSIQKCTNKFCAFLAQVESLHPSGATEQDKAKILYKEMEKSNFTMEHCWCLLRHQSKWQQHISTLGTRRRPQGEVAIDTVGENMEVFAEGPLGQKYEKERERKQKSMEGKESKISISLAKMIKDRATTMEERRNAALKADKKSEKVFELKKKKFELEKKKFEDLNETVLLDLNGTVLLDLNGTMSSVQLDS
ncbi:glutathione S-transferase T3-like [Juglans microcarpa x Juglans regia]|uniref:glutathione S-transferase T3-like n=1 Tax=Juglans microcarpa x Juglans regia TaxID=2249226 RepID=UPI001B7F59FB|nr:glutathione S-transferase T3-like [Juglans microcarpa x Juglans regia]